MISSKTEFSRVRPILGTYFKITLNHSPSEELQRILSDAFCETERLEKIFSRFDEQSNLNLLNQAQINEPITCAPELYHLLVEAIKIWRDSNFAFNPFYPQNLTSDPLQFLAHSRIIKNVELKLDLNGIAKGYIVDLIVSKLESLELSGHVNAGGDLKFFNTEIKKINFRVGTGESLVLRQAEVQQRSVATSIPRQNHNLRQNISAEHSISAVADQCYIADALTKIAIFATSEVIEFCCQKYKAQAFVFAPSGELVESMGIH